MMMDFDAVHSSGGGHASCCWICLGGDGTSATDGLAGDGAGTAAAPLERPCACPRRVHRACLARWQLQSAGRPEERACRFCGADYGDWRSVLLGGGGAGGDAEVEALIRRSFDAGANPGGAAAAQPPLMALSARGRTFKVPAAPGPVGRASFERRVRELLGGGNGGRNGNGRVDVVFEVSVPRSREKLRLAGFEAYDAAAFCAQIAAEERLGRAAAKEAAAEATPAPAAPGQERVLHTAAPCPVAQAAPAAMARVARSASARRPLMMEFIEEFPRSAQRAPGTTAAAATAAGGAGAGGHDPATPPPTADGRAPLAAAAAAAAGSGPAFGSSGPWLLSSGAVVGAGMSAGFAAGVLAFGDDDDYYGDDAAADCEPLPCYIPISRGGLILTAEGLAEWPVRPLGSGALSAEALAAPPTPCQAEPSAQPPKPPAPSAMGAKLARALRRAFAPLLPTAA